MREMHKNRVIFLDYPRLGAPVFLNMTRVKVSSDPAPLGSHSTLYYLGTPDQKNK